MELVAVIQFCKPPDERVDSHLFRSHHFHTELSGPFFFPLLSETFSHFCKVPFVLERAFPVGLHKFVDVRISNFHLSLAVVEVFPQPL